MERKELEQLEELLARSLTEEKPEAKPEETEAEALKQLPPRWEVRIQSKFDPVVEETKAYRAIAKEVDGRYDDK
ncbi:hypothetical protein [Cohnella abietis]|uniref:Uncharacterized protein n=1 Tax=Cohnella abietis TaxID=2507935 RepID=A0A3T1DC64_9BACL|nr:hypothetical protein [Cohnella abietis]BBI35736.1 hypothetical protein KCTCHS21_51350 [Cohnella abietis]